MMDLQGLVCQVCYTSKNVKKRNFPKKEILCDDCWKLFYGDGRR